MKTLTPERGLVTLRNEMDRLFDRIWEPDGFELPMTGEWFPKFDMVENQGEILIRAEVPAIEPKEIHITLDKNVLTIKGEKKREDEQKDERYYRAERAYGAFARTIRLPAYVDGKKVNAAFKNGLLTIRLPKTTEAIGTEIPIKTE